MTSITALKTPEQVKEDFANKGVSIRAWSLANGFNPTLVYDILAGHRLCVRGQSHNIAVRLGLKKGQITKSVRHAL